MNNTLKATKEEFQRFLNIHEQMYLQTLDLLKDAPDEIYDAVPIDNASMFLGVRVNKINIGSLIRHFILAEIHWFKAMKEGESGLVIPKPENAALLEGIPNGKQLTDRYKEVYEEGKVILETYTEEDINKQVTFMGRTYSVMGFLWITFGHHSYHLGQIDMLIRQNDILPIEYMEWPNVKTVIG